jgi:hypothetical protein
MNRKVILCALAALALIAGLSACPLDAPSTTGIQGVVTTLAGSGAGDSVDGTRTGASFYNPYAICTDGTNLYVVDIESNKIRKIVIATGVVTTLACYTADANGNATTTPTNFDYPYGITTVGANLYYAIPEGSIVHKYVISTGAQTTLAGTFGNYESKDGKGPLASFKEPFGITTDGTNLYVTELGSNKIRKIVIATGEVTTLTGSGSQGHDDGTSDVASFWNPMGICTDGTNLYVADTDNNMIRKVVIATGAVSTIAGTTSPGATDGIGPSASFKHPRGVVTDGTYLYVLDTSNNMVRKVVIATGAVTTLAGSTTPGSSDGTGGSASFSVPNAITYFGNALYVADSGNDLIRVIK